MGQRHGCRRRDPGTLLPQEKRPQPPAVARAIDSVNAQMKTYNRGASAEEKRPTIRVYER